MRAKSLSRRRRRRRRSGVGVTENKPPRVVKNNQARALDEAAMVVVVVVGMVVVRRGSRESLGAEVHIKRLRARSYRNLKLAAVDSTYTLSMRVFSGVKVSLSPVKERWRFRVSLLISWC